MSTRIEDYGIIGDTRTVAAVARDGSIDWWCVPRIDSGAVFASLVGEPKHGRWLIAPKGGASTVRRRYAGDSLVLETESETPDGTVKVIDFMSPGLEHPTIFRIVEGQSGSVPMRMELIARFDYGSIAPWAQSTGDGLTLVAGNDALRFHSPVPLQGSDLTTTAEFTVREGERRGFSLAWYSALDDPPPPLDAPAALRRTEQYWSEWVSRCTYQGEWRDDIVRSLITVKALQYAPTGAVCAAATTSLPEQLGGVRNWDYRFSWLRDSSLTLQALLLSGYRDEATAWQHWLQRAVAGDPGEFQIMYGVGGERRLTEVELDWLPGYENSKPVRIGNEASEQFQLDVFGEIADAALTGVEEGLRADTGLPAHHPQPGELLPAMMEHLEKVWQLPDDGIWEIRGPQRHFTQSKVMAWVAFDRAVKIVEKTGRAGLPTDRWRKLADQVKAEVCEKGFDKKKNSFVQYYGSDQLDSSLLMLARVGFLPPSDPRIIGTVDAIQRELMVDGFVQRYPTSNKDSVDGLPAGEGAFLMTTFWLVDNLALIGREKEARQLFERLRGLQNDVGLFSEEYDTKAKRLIGNFPQAFSHLGFVVSASHLSAGHPSPLGDPSVLGDMTMADHYDVVIIGSGAGGGTLAWKLAPTGKRILLLERGDYLPRERDNWDTDAVFLHAKYTTTETWSGADEKDFTPEQNYYVGGNTKFYGAALFRLRPEDFGEIKHHGGLSPAWPLSYDDFEPWYADAERLYTVHGAAGEDPTDGPRSSDYPFPAVKHESRIQKLSDDLEKLGLHPSHLPIGVMLDQDEQGDATHSSPCIRCDRVDGFPCLVDAKADAQTVCVDPALEHPNLELVTNAKVERLETDSSGHQVTAVVATLSDGTEARFSGDIVVVSCGALNSALLLLRSANDAHPHGLANGSDQVGRNYMRHNNVAMMALSIEPNPTRFQKTLALNEWYLKGEDTDYPWGGIQMLGKSDGEQLKGKAPHFLAWAAKLVPHRPVEMVAHHSVDFWLSSEDLPHPDNQISIRSDGSVRLGLVETNPEGLKRLRTKFESMLTDLGFHHRLHERKLYLHEAMDISATAHQAGTARFGSDVTRSVLDTDCKAHELDNLYVVDSSFFPSIGAVNPTLTIIANSLRVGEHLTQRLG